MKRKTVYRPTFKHGDYVHFLSDPTRGQPETKKPHIVYVDENGIVNAYCNDYRAVGNVRLVEKPASDTDVCLFCWGPHSRKTPPLSHRCR
jgi:hypothetical protein